MDTLEKAISDILCKKITYVLIIPFNEKVIESEE